MQVSGRGTLWCGLNYYAASGGSELGCHRFLLRRPVLWLWVLEGCSAQVKATAGLGCGSMCQSCRGSTARKIDIHSNGDTVVGWQMPQSVIYLAARSFGVMEPKFSVILSEKEVKTFLIAVKYSSIFCVPRFLC
jgi:hypothetical protein